MNEDNWREHTDFTGPTGIEPEKGGWEERFDQRFLDKNRPSGTTMTNAQDLLAHTRVFVREELTRAHAAGYEAGLQAAEEAVRIHTEHEGSYCDTGEDEDWYCRSKCTELALSRLQSLRRSKEV